MPALCEFIAANPFELHRQPLCVVKPVNHFVVIAPAVPPEHHVYPAITLMPPGFGGLADVQPLCAVVDDRRMIANRAAADLQSKTELSLTGTVADLQIPDPLVQESAHFLSARPAVSLRSATGLFSSRFSSSSCRVCLSSEGRDSAVFLTPGVNHGIGYTKLAADPVRMSPAQPGSEAKTICSSFSSAQPPLRECLLCRNSVSERSRILSQSRNDHYRYGRTHTLVHALHHSY